MKAKIARPFIFGPVEFEGLNLTEEEAPFDPAAQRDKVSATLERGIYLPSNTCLHGFKVKVKNRTLKRRSSLLKHARFIRNLEVTPLYPPEPEPVPEGGEGGSQAGSDN